MSVHELILEWEEALAEAQQAATPDELGDDDLEAATLGLATKSGLRAGSDFTAHYMCGTFFLHC